MPQIDGWETARRLKQNPDTAEIPIIILTAAALKQEHSNQFKSLYDGFLCKPIRRYELVEQLKRFLPVKPETLTSPQPPPTPTPAETIGEPTPESLAKLPELVEKLETEQQTHWQSLCQTMKRREVRNWAKTLHQWALEYQCQKLLDYANTLQTQLQRFDWHNLPDTVESFPHVIEEIAIRE
jgi:CheY-like chemotaxis protein